MDSLHALLPTVLRHRNRPVVHRPRLRRQELGVGVKIVVDVRQSQGADAGHLRDASCLSRRGVSRAVGDAAFYFRADGLVDEQRRPLGQFRQLRTPAGIAGKDHRVPGRFDPPRQRAADVVDLGAPRPHFRRQLRLNIQIFNKHITGNAYAVKFAYSERWKQ